jgi:hypothetical protein
VLSNYSPYNAPPECWSLLAEICETPHRPLRLGNVCETVYTGLKRDGLIPSSTSVVSQWYRREEHGYPTPWVIRDEVLGLILPALQEHRVYSRGRFGAWKYEVSNQDHSFMQGFELIDRLLGVGPEVTFSNPDVVNQRTRRRSERR